MQKFFLHQRRADSFIEDLDGGYYVDLQEALEDAEAGAREIMSERVLRGEPPDDSLFEVTDETGAVVATYPFKTALSGPASRGKPRTYTWFDDPD
jgi:hypothetical protein